MDWPGTISALKDFTIALAAAVTAVAAVRGFTSWRLEQRGKAEFEAAREMAKVTYRLRNAIQQARAPWIDANEFPESPADADLEADDHGYTQAEVRAKRHAHVFDQRLKPIYPAFDAFDAQVLEAEAFWGPSFRTAAEVLRRMPVELQESMRALVREMHSRRQRDYDDYRKGLRATVWGVSGDAENDFSVRLDGAVEAIERFLRPHLSPHRPSFFERLGGML